MVKIEFKKLLKDALGIVAPALAVVVVKCLFPRVSVGLSFNAPNNYSYDESDNPLYAKAVAAIVNSNMFSDCKSKALSYLKSNRSDSYYEAVISIARSYMNSVSMVEAIRNLG